MRVEYTREAGPNLAPGQGLKNRGWIPKEKKELN